MFKPIVGVITALVPIVYCCGLLYHFIDLTGSVQEAKEDGLGPTLLGLGIVGLLFCIPLIIKIARLFAGPRSPGSGGRGGPDAPDESGRDADAMIARYLAQRPAAAIPTAPSAPPARSGGGPARRAGFGRRTS